MSSAYVIGVANECGHGGLGAVTGQMCSDPRFFKPELG